MSKLLAFVRLAAANRADRVQGTDSMRQLMA